MVGTLPNSLPSTAKAMPLACRHPGIQKRAMSSIKTKVVTPNDKSKGLGMILRTWRRAFHATKYTGLIQGTANTEINQSVFVWELLQIFLQL